MGRHHDAAIVGCGALLFLDDTTAEIKGGLAVGEVVVTGTASDRTGTTTTTGRGGFGGVAVPGAGGAGGFRP